MGKSDVWNPDKTHKVLNTTRRDQPDTIPAWRTIGEDAPVDGDSERWHQKWPLVQIKRVHQRKWLLTQILRKNQDPEAEGGQPTDPEAPPKWLKTTTRDQPDTMSVGRDDLRRREWHKVGATKAACVDAAAACVDAAGMTLTECGRTMMRETQTNSSSKQ